MNVGPVAEQFANHVLVTALTGDEQWRSSVLPNAGNFVAHQKSSRKVRNGNAAAA